MYAPEAFAKEVDTFAPPVVVSASGTRISQSLAATAFAGDTLGFNKGLNTFKAMQFMLDLVDMMNELGGYVITSAKLDEFVARGRHDTWMSHFERGVVGPYFFGASPTYVDYYLVAQLKWIHRQVAREAPPRAYPADLLTKFPKVGGILSTLGRDADAAYAIEPMDYGPKDYLPP